MLGNQDLRTADHAAALYQRGVAPWVLFSGCRGHGTGAWEEAEAVMMARRPAVMPTRGNGQRGGSVQIDSGLGQVQIASVREGVRSAVRETGEQLVGWFGSDCSRPQFSAFGAPLSGMNHDSFRRNCD